MSRGERVHYKVTTSDLCNIHGISVASLLRDIRIGKLNPHSFQDILRWATTPRMNSNKGKSLHWLNTPKETEYPHNFPAQASK